MWLLTACCWRRNKHNHSTDFTPYEKGMILSPCISPNHLSNSFFNSPSPPSSRFHCHPLSYLYYYISLSSSPFSFSVAGLAGGGGWGWGLFLWKLRLIAREENSMRVKLKRTARRKSVASQMYARVG